MQYDLSELKKKCDFKENIFIMLQCRTTNFNGAYLLSRSSIMEQKYYPSMC